ncbi:MAG: helix-turn-helix domain-containing protein [Candidatus Gastranaerophilales bacterium]|nr:helix-turn-helix domain-containing protein [Candidatus Gastranaerophilales bacterium]
MLLGTKDLQAKLRIGRDRTYALMRASAFPSMKIGGRYYVVEAEVDDWLKRHAYKEFKL